MGVRATLEFAPQISLEGKGSKKEEEGLGEGDIERDELRNKEIQMKNIYLPI